MTSDKVVQGFIQSGLNSKEGDCTTSLFYCSHIQIETMLLPFMALISPSPVNVPLGSTWFCLLTYTIEAAARSPANSLL